MIKNNKAQLSKAEIEFYSEIISLQEILKSYKENQSFAFKASCDKTYQSVLQVFSKLEYLSVNMSIAAHKLGKEGGTLSVVASHFQITSEKIVQLFNQFQSTSTTALKKLETYENFQKKISFKSLNIIEHENILQHINSSVKEIENCNLSYKVFIEEFQQLEKIILSIQVLVTRLDLIRTGGKLEGSRTLEITKLFIPFVNEMGLLISFVENPILNQKEIFQLFSKNFSSQSENEIKFELALKNLEAIFLYNKKHDYTKVA